MKTLPIRLTPGQDLRAALEASGPRLVVFEVGGVIDLFGATLQLLNTILSRFGTPAQQGIGRAAQHARHLGRQRLGLPAPRSR